jgi:uncharacterized protein (DUF433 family)
MNYSDYIVRDPKISNGQPVIKGTRVTLRTVLASLAGGDSIDQILKSFPSLTPEAVTAVISYAAASAEEDLPVPAVPTV